jgi:tRNA pseudouridine-54 N-methylase
LTFSETSKYLINSNYLRSTPILDETNFILEKRKEIYELKKKGDDIKKIYLKLKSEIIYKKFSFLTY